MAIFRGPRSRSPRTAGKFKGPISGLRGGKDRMPKMKFGMKRNKRKSWFFNTSDWKAIMTPAQREALVTSGAYVMKAARRNLRRRKYHSAPGRSPTSWTGLLKKLIFFDYSEIHMSVVVGPEFRKSPHKHSHPSNKTIPRTLELGGNVREDRPGRWDLARNLAVRGMNLPAGRTVRIAPRPYMMPALMRSMPYIRESFHMMLNKSPRSMQYARSRAA